MDDANHKDIIIKEFSKLHNVLDPMTKKNLIKNFKNSAITHNLKNRRILVEIEERNPDLRKSLCLTFYRTGSEICSFCIF